MFIHTVKTEGIAHLSYLIGCEGQACVIDPQLDFFQYIDIAASKNCRITHIFETHRNEDFISGAPGLAEATGAKVYHGANADEPVSYAQTIEDGDIFNLSNAELSIIATPGHTKDSVCIALADTEHAKEPIAVFTGDTLFVADVGRTDFYPQQKDEMAEMLYDSLQKLIGLGDHVQIYPAHGAGSVCGGGMADREFTTIGYERKHNPRLNMASKQAFIDAKVNETHYYAPYFKTMEEYNVSGLQQELSLRGCQPLAGEQKQAWLDADNKPGVVIDVRSEKCFRESHLRGSINLPGGLLSAYGGWVLPYDTPLLLVADNTSQAQQAYMQLGRMGYLDCAGFVTALPARVQENDKLIGSIDTKTADEVEQCLDQGKSNWILLDVRKADEVENMPIPGAIHTYLGFLAQSPEDFDPNIHYTCVCGSDKRATVAASILLHNGVTNVDVFEGSFKAWKKYQQ